MTQEGRHLMLYRIDYEAFRELKIMQPVTLEKFIEQGVLVPVEPCEHGKLDGHSTEFEFQLGHTRTVWCDGAALEGDT